MRALVNESRALLETIDPSLVEIDELYRQLYANATLVRNIAVDSRYVCLQVTLHHLRLFFVQ